MMIRSILLPFFLSILLLIPGYIVFGQNDGNRAREILDSRGELYFRFNYPGRETLGQLSNVISLDEILDGKVYAYTNRDEYEAFMDYGLSPEILTAPGLLHKPVMKGKVSLKETDDWDFYPTYDAYVDLMYQFEDDYPELCTVFSIGQSEEGRDLLVARISDNVETDEGEPQFLYTSSIHGDELTGYVLTLRLIDYLLSNYGSDIQVDTLVNNLDIWINPLANPDGTYNAGNTTVYGATRYNSNGVDLNRNYPDPEDGQHPDGNSWQEETLMFMQMAEENHFVMSANFHGGTEVCNYPWDTWQELHPDDDWWQLVCHEYADTAQEYSPGGYMTGYDDGITNGYAWYTISGGRQDYMTYFHQCREFTLEISDIKLLPAASLPDLWDYNYRSMLNYMQQALYGLTGTVTDAVSGDPLLAEVFIDDHDADSSWVYTNGVNGRYFRPLFGGTYSVTFSSPGYIPQTIDDVVIVNGTLTSLDVMLFSAVLTADFTAGETTVTEGSTIDFTDLSGGMPVSWEWSFEGGAPAGSDEQNPQGILYETPGSYDVSLTISDGTDIQTIVKEDFINVLPLTGEKEIEMNPVAVFPNPASSFVRISAESPIRSIALYSIKGEHLVTYHPMTDFFLLPLESFEEGLYILSVRTDAGREEMIKLEVRK